MTFYLQDMKIQSVFFCASTDFSQNCEVNYNFFLLRKLTNLPLAFETVHCNANQKTIFFFFCFFTTFFMNQLAVVRIFLRSGTLLKNDHFHWFWCVISRFSSIKWRGKMSIWGHFLLVYFLDLLRLVISFHPLDFFGTFLKAFVSLLPAFHFLFLTFQTIRRSSLDHCALL